MIPIRPRIRVGFDARYVSYRRGIGTVTYTLLREFEAIAPEDVEFVVYVTTPEAVDDVPDDPRFTARVLRPGFYPVWEQFALPAAARRDRVDLLHCLANTGPVRMRRTIPLILAVNDVMYLLPREVLPPSPSLYQRAGRWYQRRIVPVAARRATVITTISEYSRSDVAKHLGLAAERIVVTLLAAGAEFTPAGGPEIAPTLERLGIRQPFVLALGAIDPRKNTKRLIEAFGRARAEERRLVISGLKPAEAAVFREVAERASVADRVQLLGFVSEEDLLALYRGAALFVYPSLYEGFGIPVLEAMSCGTPVVASSTTATAEVAGDAAILVDPGNTEALAAAIDRALEDAPLRRTLSEHGLRRASEFSWRRTALQILDLYRTVAGSRADRP